MNGSTLRLAVLFLVLAVPARAAEAPYETRLVRFAEILGSVHYLRNLCGETGNDWRERMETLLRTENPDPERRARLVASFNRGYRSFQSTYVQCTPSAALAIERYMKEGETIARDIVTRFGN
jgi:uncharacterized protein (TIGR02301 family)